MNNNFVVRYKEYKSHGDLIWSLPEKCMYPYSQTMTIDSSLELPLTHNHTLINKSKGSLAQLHQVDIHSRT